MTNLQMNARDWALLLGLSVIWGGSFFFNEVLLERLLPLTVVLGRVGIAALVLWAIVGVRHLREGLALPRAGSTWRDFAVMGLLNNVVPFSLIVWGQSQITGGLASILNATTPLFTVLLANVLTQDERLSSNKLVGVLLGLIGVALLMGMDAVQGLGTTVDGTARSTAWGQVAVLGAALSYAFAVIYGRRFRGIPTVITATGTLSSAALLMLPVALLVERPWTLAPTGATWAALLGLALLSTVVAYLIYYYMIAHAGSTNASLVTLLIPLSAILLGTLFLGERLAWSDFAGMALILGGLLFVDGRVLGRSVRVATLSGSREV